MKAGGGFNGGGIGSHEMAGRFGGGGGGGGGFGAAGSPGGRFYKPPVRPVPKKPAAQPNGVPYLMQSTVPAATLGGPIPGLKDYLLNLPSYGYFGLPGQTRPQSGIMGGI